MNERVAKRGVVLSALAAGLMRRAAVAAVVALVACAWLGGAARAWGSQPGARPLAVVVSIPPLKGIVEALLPPGSTVESLIPPGVSEHGYEVPPTALSRAARADLVVTVGLGLEPGVEKFLAANPRAGRREIVFHEVAKRRAGSVLPARGGDHDKHDHAEGEKPAKEAGGHDHKHGEACDACAGRVDVDPHFWLDPVLVRDLSVEVGRVVAELGGGVKQTSEATRSPALVAQLGKIDALHKRYAATISTAQRRTIVVAHDAWQYPAARFGLRVVAIAGLNGQEPTPGAIRDAAKEVRDGGLTHVFVEPQMSRRAAERIAAATGTKVAVLDPLGDGDWFGLMERNLATLATALGAQLPATMPAAEPAEPKPVPAEPKPEPVGATR